jgi:hypothetical protein
VSCTGSSAGSITTCTNPTRTLLLICPRSELLVFLRDAVETRKPPLMEVALDAIQKLISFKLLQGPAHHINHRSAAVGPCMRPLLGRS